MTSAATHVLIEAYEAKTAFYKVYSGAIDMVKKLGINKKLNAFYRNLEFFRLAFLGKLHLHGSATTTMVAVYSNASRLFFKGVKYLDKLLGGSIGYIEFEIFGSLHNSLKNELHSNIV